LLKIGRRCAIFLKKFDPTEWSSDRHYKPSNRHVIQQVLQLRKPSSQISDFNLRTGILITGCMAYGGGRKWNILITEGIARVHAGVLVCFECCLIVLWLWDEHFTYIRTRRNTSLCSFFLGMHINGILSHNWNVQDYRIKTGKRSFVCVRDGDTLSSDTVHR
jgi:hypothetical protein